jgi:hypothetical protein
MKKTLWTGLATGLVMLGMAGVAQASLTTIGSAGYDRNRNGIVENTENYKLIWDDNNNGKSVVWLDFTAGPFTTSSMKTWADGLNGPGVLSYTLNAGYSVDWGANAWRLPASVDGNYLYGHHIGNTGLGYSNTTSELGHLYYTELGNNPYRNPDGTYNSQTKIYGLLNDGDFKNLKSTPYWSGTAASGAPYYNQSAWYFDPTSGLQYVGMKSDPKSAIAVRTGRVTYIDPSVAAPIPEPETYAMMLAGLGLLGFMSRRKKQSS